MTTHSTVLKFESGDSIEVEPRAFDGPLLHIGHNGDASSKLRLTGTEAIGLVSELIGSLSSGMRLGIEVAADSELSLCQHGHALCSICNVMGRNSVPEEISQ